MRRLAENRPWKGVETCGGGRGATRPTALVGLAFHRRPRTGLGIFSACLPCRGGEVVESVRLGELVQSANQKVGADADTFSLTRSTEFAGEVLRVLKQISSCLSMKRACLVAKHAPEASVNLRTPCLALQAEEDAATTISLIERKAA